LYTSAINGTPQQEELGIFGASRIGLNFKQDNQYVYELSDHLGNVRVTFGEDASGDLQTYTYSDYFPFGMKIPGRLKTTGEYRFAYQGLFSEEDPETGYNSFDLRMYDPKTGRWMIPDPARQFWSPYLAMGNNPPNVIDMDGDVAWFVPGIVGGVVAIGFNINAQLQDGTFDLTSGKTWARMGVAGGTGFGLAYTPGGWVGIATAGVASGTSNVLDQAIKNGGFNNIDKTEVAASTIGGTIGYKTGSVIGEHIKPGTMAGSLLINNFSVNFRDEAVKNAIRSATAAAGGMAGGYSGMWLNNLFNFEFGDNMIRGVTPWGHSYCVKPGEVVNLPEIVITAPKPN
jgi:RHS repeat-associated protein